MQPKSAAMNPPAHARIQGRPDDQQGNISNASPSNKEVKKREARTRRRLVRSSADATQNSQEGVQSQEQSADRTVAAVPEGSSTPGPVAQALAAAEAARAEPAQAKHLSLPPAILEQMSELRPALGPLTDLLAAEAIAPSPGEARIAADTVAKFIGDRGPCATVAKRAHLLTQSATRRRSSPWAVRTVWPPMLQVCRAS